MVDNTAVLEEFLNVKNTRKQILANIIKEKYDIEVPSVYQYVNQTGCAGCPYGIRLRGNNEGVKKEIELLSENKRKFVLDYFYESYRAKNFNYFFEDKTDLLDLP